MRPAMRRRRTSGPLTQLNPLPHLTNIRIRIPSFMHTMSRYTILFICPVRIFVMRLRKRVAAVRSWIAIKTISLAILPAVANAQAAEPVQDEVCADDIIVTGTGEHVRSQIGRASGREGV